ERLPAAALRVAAVDVVDIDDRLGALAQLRQLRFTCSRLARPRMRTAAGFDPAATEPGHTGPRQMRSLRAYTRPEREHVEAVVAGPKGVQLTRPVDDAVARPDLESGAIEEADARAPEHVEDLLLRRLPVE